MTNYEMLVITGTLQEFIQDVYCYNGQNDCLEGKYKDLQIPWGASISEQISNWLQAEYINNLKPCPFCGNNTIEIVVDDETETKFGVKCFKCGGAIYAEEETLKDAENAWNRRAK